MSGAELSIEHSGQFTDSLRAMIVDRELPAPTVSITGGGDPLVAEHLPAIYKHAASLVPRQISLVTSGIWSKEEDERFDEVASMARALNSARLDKIWPGCPHGSTVKAYLCLSVHNESSSLQRAVTTLRKRCGRTVLRHVVPASSAPHTAPEKTIVDLAGVLNTEGYSFTFNKRSMDSKIFFRRGRHLVEYRSMQISPEGRALNRPEFCTDVETCPLVAAYWQGGRSGMLTLYPDGKAGPFCECPAGVSNLTREALANCLDAQGALGRKLMKAAADGAKIHVGSSFCHKECLELQRQLFGS
jgi:hypothetical protein